MPDETGCLATHKKYFATQFQVVTHRLKNQGKVGGGT
jgi:hypothetical protein